VSRSINCALDAIINNGTVSTT